MPTSAISKSYGTALPKKRTSSDAPGSPSKSSSSSEKSEACHEAEDSTSHKSTARVNGSAATFDKKQCTKSYSISQQNGQKFSPPETAKSATSVSDMNVIDCSPSVDANGAEKESMNSEIEVSPPSTSSSASSTRKVSSRVGSASSICGDLMRKDSASTTSQMPSLEREGASVRISEEPCNGSSSGSAVTPAGTALSSEGRSKDDRKEATEDAEVVSFFRYSSCRTV